VADNFFAQFDAPIAPEGEPGRSASPLRIEVRPIRPIDRDLTVRTIYGEASGEGDEGQLAVANVIANRLQSGRWGDTLKDVVLAKGQFEPWMRADARARMQRLRRDDPTYERIGKIVDWALAGEIPDITDGATHFYAPKVQAELGRNAPGWGRSQPLAKIGAHHFFAPEGRVEAAGYAPEEKPAPSMADFVAAPAGSAARSEGPPASVAAAPQMAPPAEPNFFAQFDQQPPAQPSAPSEPSAPGPAGPQFGAGETLGRSIGRGATFNFLEELLAAHRAGRGATPLPQARPGGVASAIEPMGTGLAPLFRGIGGMIAGNPGASNLYDEELAKQNATSKAMQEQRPVLSTAGELGGALMSPVPIGGGAAGFGTRMLRSAGAGAVGGGLGSAGEGEGAGDRLSRGAIGTVLGAGLGAVAQPAIEGVGRLGNAAIAKIMQEGRSIFRPQAEARRMAGTTLGHDALSDPGAASRMTGAEMAATPQANVLDTGGQATRRLADVAAITSPAAEQTLKAGMQPRFASQNERLADWFNTRFHYPNPTATAEAIDTAQRTVNKAAYDKFYNATRNGLWSQRLEELTSAPEVVKAMQEAVTSGKNRAVGDGYAGFNPGVTFENGMVQFRAKPNGQPAFPDGQFWDYTYRKLRDTASELARKGRNDDASAIGGLARKLRDEVDSLATDNGEPLFRQARAGAARFFQAEDALEAGQNFARGGFNNDEARAAIAKMAPIEKKLFQDGFVHEFLDKQSGVSNRADLSIRLLDNDKGIAQMGIALGRDRAAELEVFVRAERIMAASRAAVTGNSWTARRLADMGIMSGGGVLAGAGGLNADPKTMTEGAIIGAIGFGHRRVNQNVMQHVARLLMSRDTDQFQRGIQSVARNRSFLESLRAFDRRLAAGSSEQVPSGFAPQLLGVGRADQGREQE